MPLEEYRRKRDPRRTPEPIPDGDPDPAVGPGNRFVIQEHHASQLHWDVRLERDGVLVSWAVPKGLPPDPETVRLAVRTEDHPIEYLEFSGEIPAGEYGAGRMTIWDTGTYEPEKWNPREVIVELHGARAGGRFVFIRSARSGSRDTGRNEWLLRRSDPAPGREPLPRDARPAVAAPGPLPRSLGWSLQVGFGGRPVIVRVDGGRARITDADGAEIPLPGPLRGFGASLGTTQVLLDAELTDRGELWIDDLLHLDGRDTRGLPFRDRVELLAGLPLTGPRWRLAPVFPDGGAEVLGAVAAQGLPWVIAKRSDSSYRLDPGTDWVRVATAATASEPGDPVPPPVGSRSRPAEHGPTAPGVGRARLTNPRKVLYPLTGTTKSAVLEHYLRVAEVMLPHLRDRAATLVRWPDGVDHPSFFEKDVSRHAPGWVRTARVGTPGGRSEFADFPVIDDVQGLAWAANLAALELHVPQWRLGPGDARLLPDLVVFDLDPGEGTTVVDCARVAERLADELAELGLTGYPRTSGGKGMQLYVPAAATRPEQTSEFAKAMAERLAAQTPRSVTAVMAKARRRGRVFVDWSQNNPHKTTIASYSLRGRPRPTVATPVTWDEVRAARYPADLTFTIDDLPARIDRHGDLMSGLLSPAEPLPTIVPQGFG